jgi:hypothetical protein
LIGPQATDFGMTGHLNLPSPNHFGGIVSMKNHTKTKVYPETKVTFATTSPNHSNRN